MKKAGNMVMVIGCGTMGSGIVTSFLSCKDISVIVVENNPKMFQKLTSVKLSPEHYLSLSADGHVRVSPQLIIVDSLMTWSKSKCPLPDLVVEAVPEKIDLKLKIYEETEKILGDDVIIGSNTSTLPLQTMADKLNHPHRFVGFHYNHPAHLIPIVEVTKLRETSQLAMDISLQFLKKCGKIPVVLLKPIDGFITNRLQHAMYREIYALMEDGSVGPEDIDNVAKHMFGPRMCVTGLLLQKDCSGLDTHTFAQREMVKVLANNTTCGKVLEGKFKKGEFGLKSGQGFYPWNNSPESNPDKIQGDINGRLQRVYEFLSQNKIIYDPPKARL